MDHKAFNIKKSGIDHSSLHVFQGSCSRKDVSIMGLLSFALFC